MVWLYRMRLRVKLYYIYISAQENLRPKNQLRVKDHKVLDSVHVF